MTPTPRGGEAITMQDVRLCAGEGKLSAHDVLNAVNAILRNRRPPDGWPDREAVARACVAFKAELQRQGALWTDGEPPETLMMSTGASADLAKALEAILSLFPPVVGWREIDTAPRDGTRIVGWGFLNDRNDNGPLRSSAPVAHIMQWRPWRDTDAGDWVSTCISSSISQHPTHWMPLPAAPLTDGEGE